MAIGSACRQAGRAIEDCFTMNGDAPKASVFAGWKEMNDYMVANKLEAVKPEVPRPDKEAKAEGKGKDEAKKEEGSRGPALGTPTAREVCHESRAVKAELAWAAKAALDPRSDRCFTPSAAHTTPQRGACGLLGMVLLDIDGEKCYDGVLYMRG